MTAQEIINGLYLEMLFVAVILLGILFINNIVLYKQKLRDRISVMLLTAVILGCFEILWALCDGNPKLTALTYIGAMDISKYRNTEITLKKGDSIFVYTDGVAEVTDANNELFGTDRTLEALNAIPAGASQKEILAGVRAAVDAFVKEAPQFDDLTMLGLKYNGPQDDAAAEEAP